MVEIAFAASTIAVIAGMIVWWWRRNIRIVTVRDYESGLLYKNGSFIGVLSAGRYRLLKDRDSMDVVDRRNAELFIPQQNVLTKDAINIRINLTGTYRVDDPNLYRLGGTRPQTELYIHAQLAFRDGVGSLTLDEVLEKKSTLGETLTASLADKARALGIAVTMLAIKDIVLPPSLKRAYAGILEAQKDAQKKLEQARGEQAVLRNLANSSAMYDKNPMLLQARLIQALANGSNSIVFNAEGGLISPKSMHSG